MHMLKRLRLNSIESCWSWRLRYLLPSIFQKIHGFQQFGMAAPVAATDAFNFYAKSTRPLMSHFQFVASGMQTEIQPQAQK